MSYFNSVSIAAGSNLDAFGRLRVSEPLELFSDMSEYGLNLNKWETASLSGSLSYVVSQSAVRLTTGGTTSGNYVIRQSRYYARYQPGRSQLILGTFVMGTVQTGTAARFGYFDDNDGIYFERSGSQLNINLRTSTGGAIAETRVSQSAWVGDKLDGTGASGFILDTTKANIFWIQFEYLGVGQVQFGFIINGTFQSCHTFNNANNITSVYMRRGCLPVRYEVRNLAAAGGTLTMDSICSTVMSEGANDQAKAIQYSAQNTTAITVGNGTLTPLISIRAAQTGSNGVPNRGQIIPISLDLLNTGNNSVRYQIVRNGTLTGPSWSISDPSSICQFDTSSTAISGGTQIDGGFSLTKGASTGMLDLEMPLVYTSLGGIQDTYTLAAAGIGNTSTVLGSIAWKELW